MRRAVVGLAAVVLLASGFTALRHRHPRAPARVAATAKSRSTAAESPITPAPVASGTSDDAVTTALTLLKLSETVLTMTESDAIAAQTSVSTTSAAPVLAAKLRAQLDALRAGFGDDATRQWLSPIGIKVDFAGETEATVAIWYVAVVWTTRFPAYQQWRTVTYRLVREGGRWLEAAEDDLAGPVPSALSDAQPSNDEALSAMFTQFASLPAGG